MKLRTCLPVWATLVCVTCTSAQEARSAHPDLPQVETPAGWREGEWLPMAALWGRSDGQLDDARAAAVAAAGVGVARIPAQKSAEEVGALLDALRRRYRIDQGGLHALVGGEGVTALAAIAANRHQFQTVTTFGDAAGVDLGLAGRMRGRRVPWGPAACSILQSYPIPRLWPNGAILPGRLTIAAADDRRPGGHRRSKPRRASLPPRRRATRSFR